MWEGLLEHPVGPAEDTFFSSCWCICPSGRKEEETGQEDLAYLLRHMLKTTKKTYLRSPEYFQ
jgi:hypothetical protein